MIKIGAWFKLLEALPASLLVGFSPGPCPSYKKLTLRGFDVGLETDGRTFELSTTDAPTGDGFRSRGLAFARRVVPLASGLSLEQQIALPNAGDTVGISWRLLGNKITPVRLTATPIFSSTEPISSEIFVFDADHDGGRLTWSPFRRFGRIIADTNGHPTEPSVITDFDGRENIAAPSAFVFDLGGSPALLLLSAELAKDSAMDPLIGEFLANIPKFRSEDSNLGIAA